MDQLKCEDLSWSRDRRRVAVHFGRGARGERSKTGRDQGVTFDTPWVVAILDRRSAGKAADDKVFPLSSSAYRKWWRAAADAVLGKGAGLGPPHSARHTGAARDLAEGYRSFEQVQRRGRWQAQSSVQRYARTHAWVAAVAATPPQVQKKGADIFGTTGSQATDACRLMRRRHGRR